MTEFLADGPDWHLWSWTGVWFSFFSAVDEWIGSDIWELHSMDSIPADKVLKKTRLDLQKRFPKNHVCPKCLAPFSAARHSYRTALHSTRNWMRCERHRSTGNVGMSTAYWFSILKFFWIIHTINFILQILYLASKFQNSILVFDQSSSCNSVEGGTLKLLQFFHFIETFHMSFTKIPVLLQYLFMKKLMILSSFFCLSTMKFFLLRLDRFIQFLYFFGHNQPGVRVFESPLDSERESAPFVGPRESYSVHFQRCVSEFLERSKQVGKQRVSPFYHDKQDDRPSPSEWSARLRHASRRVWPMVMSS